MLKTTLYLSVVLALAAPAFAQEFTVEKKGATSKKP